MGSIINPSYTWGNNDTRGYFPSSANQKWWTPLLPTCFGKDAGKEDTRLSGAVLDLEVNKSCWNPSVWMSHYSTQSVSAASLRHGKGGVLTSSASKNRVKRGWKIPTLTAKQTSQPGVGKQWGFDNQVEGKEGQLECLGTQGSSEWGREPIFPEWTFKKVFFLIVV